MKDGKLSWNICKKEIKDLIFYRKNPRKLSKKNAAQIKKSLDKFGLCQPIIINLDGTIIGGHQRVALLRDSGKRLIECYQPNRMLEEKEVEELNIRLNRNSGEFDFDILANEWEFDDLIEWGFDNKDFELHPEETTGQEVNKIIKMTIEFTDQNIADKAQEILQPLIDEYNLKIKVK